MDHLSGNSSESLDSEENYYAAIEKHFIRLRGGPLFITPKDWQLIYDWHERQIPFRVVEAGLDRAFGKRKSHRPVRSLSYCRQSVEAEYRRHSEVMVGALEDDPSRSSETRDYLVRLEDKLNGVAESSKTTHPRLAVSAKHCSRRLAVLVEVLVDAVEEPRVLEREMERLEAGLLEAAESSLDEEERRGCLGEAERSLRDYKDRMPPDVYASALSSAYHKRVRALLGLPALSLFYL